MTAAAERLWSALFAGGDAVGEGRELVLFFMGAPHPDTGRKQRRAAWARSLPEALAALAAPEHVGLSAYFHVALHDRAAAVASAHRRDEAKGRRPRPLRAV